MARAVRKSGVGTVLILIVGSAGIAAPSAAECGPPRDLGTLGGDASFARGINRVGQIVGDSINTQGTQRAFLWERGVMLDLGSLREGDESFSQANGINDRGEVVGWSISGIDPHAFLWRHGIMTDLGTLPGTQSSFASDINNRGQIAGRSDDTATLWQRDGAIQALAIPGAVTSEASAINDRGQVAATATIRSLGTRAVLWEDGVATVLGTLGGFESRANGINDRGQVVGESTTASGAVHAFLWDQGRLIDLGVARRGDRSRALDNQPAGGGRR